MIDHHNDDDDDNDNDVDDYVNDDVKADQYFKGLKLIFIYFEKKNSPKLTLTLNDSLFAIKHNITGHF